MRKIIGFCLLVLVSFALCGCKKQSEGGAFGEELHRYKAPLYWSVYEYCWGLERAGIPASEMDVTEEQWDKIIDWVATDLKPYGYDMVCTDGFIPFIGFKWDHSAPMEKCHFTKINFAIDLIKINPNMRDAI